MEDKHQTMIFWFCCSLTGFACALIFCFLYVPIPASNKSYADVILGFITGTVFATAINYLLGGNPKTNQDKPTVQNADTVNVDQSQK